LVNNSILTASTTGTVTLTYEVAKDYDPGVFVSIMGYESTPLNNYVRITTFSQDVTRTECKIFLEVWSGTMVPYMKLSIVIARKDFDIGY
jgi:hypothetical protein